MIDNYISPYTLSDMADIDIPRSTNKPIAKAEQTKPNSRSARRQEKREKERKWSVRYKEERDED